MNTLVYLLELRQRLIRVLIVFAFFCIIFFIFDKKLFYFFIFPFQHFFKGQTIIATQVISPLITPLKLAIHIALFCSLPYAFWEFWQFLAPALYLSERKKFSYLLFGSLSLGILGMLFCYYFVLPSMFYFFNLSLPQNIQYMPDIDSIFNFFIKMLLTFCICFQLPSICFILVYLKLVSYQQLLKARPYAIVIAFTLGMLLTPPDVFSQIILAIPLWGLFELGILLLKLTQKSSESSQI